MKNLIFTLIFIFLCVLSCNINETAQCFLEETDVEILLKIDSTTKNNSFALFPYIDEKGEEFLSFQNMGKNEILIFGMESEELLFKITPEVAGNNGVGFFVGYYIYNFDSIFLTIRGVDEIALINRYGEVKDKYQYSEATDGTVLKNYYSVSDRFQPLVLMENKLYIMPRCNRWAENNPACATIDIISKEVESLNAFQYPKFANSNNKSKRASAELYVSRVFADDQFVYSFYFDENIYIASIDHSNIRKIKIKSKLLNEIRMLDDFGNLTHEDGCRNPNYGNLLFDNYRKVYYRIAYPEVELEEGVKGHELLDYGRKRFSIIILDKYFNKIGETLLSDYTYNSTLMFIREDGLYISNSHYLNPNFSDDILSFRRFDLVEN